MKYAFLFSFLIASIIGSSQDNNNQLDGFSPLIGKTWVAEGQWGDGSVFKQEITFSSKLDGKLIMAESDGFIDQSQTGWGHRNHGIRKWNKEKGIIEFWEYDVFGGMTYGTVAMEGKNIFYSYDYGGTLITDAWIYKDDRTYQFKVGSYEGGKWNQVYLDTEFKALPIYTGSREDLNTLLAGMKTFSETYMKEDHIAISEFYTEDGKIMPNGTPIIEGREAIAERWKLKDDVDILHHAIYPVEVNIIDDIAYDYGYYEGSTKVGDQAATNWKGKYVIIWKKVNGKWLMDVDIWNRVND
ncbi:MAG: nuclear transport factor 2 family protein [Saprospiraceae bacterium]|nr:nuclear transport factor 2 family protein [Saprospiraceae bacterium]